jgi:phospholipid/cholesterol/gamma-HCH transport system substrate-binding protein
VRSFRDRNPYLVGLFSILLLLGLVGFAFSVGILQLFKGHYTARGVFSDASGIKRGDDVKMAGIKVGLVTGIRPDRARGNVIVEFQVDDGVKVADDATAEIALQTLLGTKYLRLGGPVRAPYLASMPAGAREIPRERTKTPFDVFELTKVATTNVNATDTDKLNKLIRSLADVTQGQKEQVAQLLSGITDLSATLNSRDAQLRGLLDRAQQLTGVLAEKDQALVALVDQSKRILDLIDARRGDISQLLRSGNALVSELARILGVNKAQIDVLLKSLHPVVETVKANQAALDRAAGLVGPGFLGLGLSPTHGPWQDVYIQAIGPDVVCLLGKLSGQTCPSQVTG